MPFALGRSLLLFTQAVVHTRQVIMRHTNAFIEEPLETIAKLAPSAVSTHEDLAFTVDTQSTLMNEAVLGSFVVKLAEALRLLRHYRPKTRFTLEMIKREPLRVPVFTDEYRATLPAWKAEDWERFLRLVHSQVQPLLRNTGEEDQNIAACFAAWPNLIRQIDSASCFSSPVAAACSLWLSKTKPNS